MLFVRPAGGFWARQRGMCIRKSAYKNYLKMYMFSSGTGPAPNPGRAIALHLLRNCVSHMSGRMPAAFCVYPTIHIKSERKCICLYIQNVLQAAVVKMCIPYHTYLFIKKVYTLLYIQNCHALPLFQLPAAMCTHMHMHFIKKSAHPTIHTNLPAAVRKRRKNAVLQAGQQLQTNCGVHGQRPCTASALPLHPHRAHNLPAIHPAAAPRSRLPATLPRCRAHKNKKRRKNTGNTRCVKKKNMKKEIKMDKYRKKNQKNKRK